MARRVFYITHAHSAISANSATLINNCVHGTAAQLASDLSAIATSGLSAEHQLLAGVVDPAVPPKKHE